MPTILSLLLFISFSIHAQSLLTPSKETIHLRLAINKEDQTKGLSGMKPQHFKDHEGMLFVYETPGSRRFWMPDTYFNLDIYFLDSNFKILAVEKNVPHHPGIKEPPAIYQTATYEAHHVLEMKASSPLSKKLKVGDQLLWSDKKKDLNFFRKKN